MSKLPQIRFDISVSGEEKTENVLFCVKNDFRILQTFCSVSKNLIPIFFTFSPQPHKKIFRKYTKDTLSPLVENFDISLSKYNQCKNRKFQRR